MKTKKRQIRKVVARPASKSGYGRLTETKAFDVEKARELALLHTEIEQLTARIGYLGEISHRNRNLQEFLWRTLDGKYIVITDIADDHLKNIVKYLVEKGRNIPFNIRAEYTKRFGEAIKEIPKKFPSSAAGYFLSERSDYHDDDDRDW